MSLIADGIAPHRLDLRAELNQHLGSVHRTGGVTHHALRMLPGLLDRADRRLDVAQSLSASNTSKDIHAVPGGAATKASTTSSGKLVYCTMFWPRSQHRLRSFRREALHRVEPVKREFGQKRSPESIVAPPHVPGRRSQRCRALGAQFQSAWSSCEWRPATGVRRAGQVLLKTTGNSTHGWVKPDNMRGPTAFSTPTCADATRPVVKSGGF